MASVQKSAGLASRLYNAFRAWYANAAGYRQLGLKADDLLDEDLPEVAEALKRMDENAQYERLFRMKRSLDLSLKHSILPKDQWTKPEEDDHYLLPIMETVKKEMAERKKWDQM
eukprot:gene10145-11179_t